MKEDICSSRRFSALSWSPWAPGMQVVGRYICRQNTHKQKKLKKKPKEEEGEGAISCFQKKVGGTSPGDMVEIKELQHRRECEQKLATKPSVH